MEVGKAGGFSLVAQLVKNLPGMQIPGLGRSPGEGNGNPPQCSCLENPKDRGTWRTIVHGVAGVRHDLATKPPPPARLERSVDNDTARLCKHVERTCVCSSPVSFWKLSVVTPPSSRGQVAPLGFHGALVFHHGGL